MPQTSEATAPRVTVTDEPKRPFADAVGCSRYALAPLPKPAMINGLRVRGDRIAKGRDQHDVPPYDEDKALDEALNALARDLGVKLED